MSEEKLEKRLEFVIEQQAQFTSDMQELRESQAQTDRAVRRSEEVIAQTGEIVARLSYATLEGFKDVNAKIDALVDSQIRTDEKFLRTDERFQETDERFREVAARFKETDVRFKDTDKVFKELSDIHLQTAAALKHLTATVDRHISEGKNGN